MASGTDDVSCIIADVASSEETFVVPSVAVGVPEEEQAPSASENTAAPKRSEERFIEK